MNRSQRPRPILFFIFFLITLALAVSPLAQNVPDNHRELEQSLQSRYRPAVLGKGIMGIGGENAMRRAGGVVFLRQAGLWGSLDRRQTASWAIRGNHTELLAGRKDVELQSGEKFYVTSVTVGSDVVEIGLLSTGNVSAGKQSGRIWATAAFFFDPKVLDQGDMNSIQSELDQWLGQGDSVVPPVAAPIPARAEMTAPAQTPVTRSELKPGMSREEIVQAAGVPQSELSFGQRRWLTYPGLVAILEDGKLVSVDRSLQPPAKISVRSEPVGADVFLDGKFVGQTPSNLQLPAGTYSLGVRLQGYEPWQKQLSALAGSDSSVDAKLESVRNK